MRYPEGKMLIIWGHDEAIVKQFTLTSKSWVGTNGETAIVPKDDGCGIMISAFQCREFGFGLQISKEDMARVNAFRKEQVYKDEAAAKAKRGDTKKKLLPIHHSSIILSMVQMVKNIGFMSTWCSSWKTVQTAWQSCTWNMVSFFS